MMYLIQIIAIQIKSFSDKNSLKTKNIVFQSVINLFIHMQNLYT